MGQKSYAVWKTSPRSGPGVFQSALCVLGSHHVRVGVTVGHFNPCHFSHRTLLFSTLKKGKLTYALRSDGMDIL